MRLLFPSYPCLIHGSEKMNDGGNPMNRYSMLFPALLGLALCGCTHQTQPPAPEKPGAAVIGAASVNATIEAIDYKTRRVKLKDETGKTLTLKVGEYAQNFNQLRVGDTVTFDYVEAVAVEVQKASEGPREEADVTVERAPPGSTPAGVISGTYRVKARVEDINYDTRHVTLKGPEGNLLTLKVGDEVKRFKEVKKGDEVVVQYTEALGISVKPKR